MNTSEGVVSIGEEKVEINGSISTSLKMWFRERKSTFLLIILGVVLVTVMGVFDIGQLTRPLIGVFLVVAGAMIVESVLRHFDILETKSTIPLQSVERVIASDMGRVKSSSLKIQYSDDDGEIHIRKIQLANPIMSSDDRVDPAIEAFEEAGVKIDGQSNSTVSN